MDNDLSTSSVLGQAPEGFKRYLSWFSGHWLAGLGRDGYYLTPPRALKNADRVYAAVGGHEAYRASMTFRRCVISPPAGDSKHFSVKLDETGDSWGILVTSDMPSNMLPFMGQLPGKAFWAGAFTPGKGKYYRPHIAILRDSDEVIGEIETVGPF